MWIWMKRVWPRLNPFNPNWPNCPIYANEIKTLWTFVGQFLIGLITVSTRWQKDAAIQKTERELCINILFCKCLNFSAIKVNFSFFKMILLKVQVSEFIVVSVNSVALTECPLLTVTAYWKRHSTYLICHWELCTLRARFMHTLCMICSISLNNLCTLYTDGLTQG